MCLHVTRGARGRLTRTPRRAPAQLARALRGGLPSLTQLVVAEYARARPALACPRCVLAAMEGELPRGGGGAASAVPLSRDAPVPAES